MSFLANGQHAHGEEAGKFLIEQTVWKCKEGDVSLPLKQTVCVCVWLTQVVVSLVPLQNVLTGEYLSQWIDGDSLDNNFWEKMHYML